MINNKKEADDTNSLNELGKDSKEKFYVAKPSLPDIDDFIPYLEKMWATGVISNNGPFNQELEKKLAEYLEVPYLSLFSNGTLALITAIQASNLSGEVITSPFTFIATPNSLVWNNLKPVFVDVDPIFGNLNPAKIEEAINEKTSAILPVHVYGNPCDIEGIDKIAKKHNLKVIYDAAHAFGVRYNNQSVLNFGDFSILSLHATKVFNTFEGGAVISKDLDTKNRIDRLRNFGIVDETTVSEIGSNSKMNEMQAAIGLLQLKKIDEYISSRKKIAEVYDKGLEAVSGVDILVKRKNSSFSYGYYPIFIDKDQYGMSRDDLYFLLKKRGIFSRRYFFPLVSNFLPYRDFPSSRKSNLPIANKLADSVLCLPIYASLEHVIVKKIIKIIKNK